VQPSEIDKLRSELDSLDLSGKKVIPFKGLSLMERAFFPGGNGLFLGNRGGIPAGGTLVLGSNFGCEADYLDANGSLRRQDGTQSSSTWKGLFRVLTPRTGIELNQCFFTNAWPFLHEGTSNETKGLISAWLADDALMKKCLNFFERTLLMMRPKLVIALGTGASAFLSCLWPDKMSAWRGNSVASMDALPIAEAEFSNRCLVCTAITHPSHSNSWRRTPPLHGLQGEIDLLRQAAIKAGINGAGKRRGRLACI
jgi:hypothetical protein